MVRQARAEITRDTVLSGAANVFLRLGYANAGLSEIISQSQVTKGALYFHFGSKEELARAVIDEGNSRLVTACKQFNDGRIPALEAAIGISYIVVDMSVSDPMVSAMLRLSHQIGDYRGTQGNVMAGWSEAFDHLAAKAIKQGDLDADADSNAYAYTDAYAYTYTDAHTCSHSYAGASLHFGTNGYALAYTQCAVSHHNDYGF